MIELRECPFCGCKKIEIYEERMYQYAAQCVYCGSTGPNSPDADKAAINWNKREEDKKNV